MGTGLKKKRLSSKAQELKQRIQAGNSYADIAREFKVSRQAIAGLSKQYGLDALKSKVRNQAKIKTYRCTVCGRTFKSDTPSRRCEQHKYVNNAVSKCYCGSPAKYKGLCVKHYYKQDNGCILCDTPNGRQICIDSDRHICRKCYQRLRHTYKKQLHCTPEEFDAIQYLIMLALSRGKYLD